MTNLDCVLKSRDITLPTKVCLVKASFSSSHVWMWELGHKEGWALKIWCFQIVVLKILLRVTWTARRSNQSILKETQPWIGRTDAEAAAPILWPPDGKSWLIGKDPDAGKDRRQEEKGMTEDKMVGWHHQLNGHEFEHSLGDGEGQENLACCSPWGCRFRHNWVTEQQSSQVTLYFYWKRLSCFRQILYLLTMIGRYIPDLLSPNSKRISK